MACWIPGIAPDTLKSRLQTGTVAAVVLSIGIICVSYVTWIDILSLFTFELIYIC
jgi:hypothetical protein